MNPLCRFTALARLLLLAGALFAAARPAPAQTAAVGTIEGRVLNPRNGEYVENAHVTVEGTSLETFSDSSGSYRLTNVPAGTARVKTFFTGLPAQTVTVEVAPGQVATRDISLAGPLMKTDGTVVTLDAFRVETSREMEASALAINEQRFASNIKNVLSTDEFGNVAEGNAAEFLKFLPGVTIDYTGGNARDISINGVPSDNVPVTLDGFSIASAPGNATGRSVASDMISINNLSRIEVSYSPTPESQGSALAGSVNMVPRSSFERAKPILNASVYVIMRDNARDFHKVPGPKPSATRNVHPGFDFAYVAPVNKRFGYTLSAGTSTNYSPQDNSQNVAWRGVQTATNGTTFPHTTVGNPYLTQYQVQDAPKVTTRRSVGASIDYKFTPYDRVSLGFQYSSFDGQYIVSSVNFNVGGVRPGDFTTTSTQGTPGAGVLQTLHQERNRFNRTRMPTLVWRHDGPVWKADGGLGYSLQDDGNPDTEQGYFRNVTMQRSNVTIAFKDNFYLRPREITVRDGATGAPVDPFALSTYAMVSATTQVDTNIDRQKTAYGSLSRNFYTQIPFTLKTGFDVRQSIRDNRGGTLTSNFVGRDGIASTAPLGDDSPVPFFDPIYSQRILPFGFPKLESPSNRKVYEYSVANPTHFTRNENTSYRNLVTASKHSEEIISSLYLRGDMSLLQNRLKLVGGIRAEQTNAEGEGPLSDATRNYQRNASGQILRNANGTPVLIVPTTNALGVSQLTYLDRGARTEKEYLRYFPSLNASYNVRENLIARASYYHSVGRPNFSQYSGGITLPDTGNPPTAGNRISVNNAAIKAWSARTVNLRLERYFEGVGQVSVGAFRRQIENFFGNTVFRPTPEFLALYGLDAAEYGAYDVATNHNVEGTVRTEGLDFNYKQALTFLPTWARGVQVFANASAQRVTGDDTVSFAGFIPRSGSWGVSLTRPTYNVRLNWNYRGRSRNNLIAAGNSIEPGTFNWTSKRLYMDVVGEYYFWKRTAFFFNFRNIGDATEDVKIYGPSTPDVARFRTRIDYASLWTFGVKGTW